MFYLFIGFIIVITIIFVIAGVKALIILAKEEEKLIAESNSLLKEPDYQPITKVFALAKGSIDTSYMAGDHLPPLNSFNPTIKNVFFRWVRSLFHKDKEKKLED